jgi:hypothetical protein
MSTQHVARIVYGFPAETPVARDRKSGAAVYLSEWLESIESPCDDIMAGLTNGGSPDHFVGVEIARVYDYCRRQPWAPLEGLAVSDEQETAVCVARANLSALDPALILGETGFYLMGEAQ